ncbi:MAG: glutathione S-transferase family protein [Sandaracinaceae bacterium]|nr:glutathione S-transferase family protein [Sandaracinaceae bacterium]
MPETLEADLVLHYAPRTRSLVALWLLEELGVPYRLASFDLATGHHKSPEHLALNPMGKVPVVVDRGVPVSELGAIAIYLADRYPAAGLAPALDHPDRAAYLRWVFFSSAIIEPALAEKFGKWEPRPRQHAWGSFDQMLEVATRGVSSGTYLLGDRFCAADVTVAGGLRYAMLFGAIPKEGPIADYVGRVTAREAFARASAIEAREGERFPMKKP